MLQEEWKPIKGYEGLYEVSNFGKVKSLPRGSRIKIEIILRPNYHNNRYLTVGLCKDGASKSFRIHHLVWEHFGDRPRNGRKLQVDHKDENKLNNRIDNLQLLTNRENTIKFRKITKNNGLPIGVYKNNYGFVARYWLKGKCCYIGIYNTPEEASCAYQEKIK